MVVGGALTIRQYLAAGLLDELRITVTPVILGAGERLFDGIGTPRLTQVESVASASVTHLRYRMEQCGPAQS
jgi:dihydrofolate reductase